MKSQQLTYTIEVHEPQEGERGFWVSVPALPGCFTQGQTYEEAVERAHEAIACHLEALLKRGEIIPEEARHPSLVGVQVGLPLPA
jgi:antitoxin HicB